MKLNFISLIFLSLIYSCNDVSNKQNKNGSIPTSKYIDFSPIDFPKNETKRLHREITKTLKTKERVSVFNDSLEVTFNYLENNIFLYIVSKEIGESRKVPGTKVGDTIQIMRHVIIVESQIENPNHTDPLVKFKLLEYKSN